MRAALATAGLVLSAVGIGMLLCTLWAIRQYQRTVADLLAAINATIERLERTQ